MTNLLVIRHAETDLAGAFCGHSDPEVNAAGHRQIERLAESLYDERPDAVYTSDLKRAITTARAVAKRFDLPEWVRPGLRELCFGQWEGRRWAEIEAADPHHASEWLRSFPWLPAPGGETYADFESRVLEEVDYLFNQPAFQKVAVITHAGVMRVMLRHLTHIDEGEAWRLAIPYCAVVRVRDGAIQEAALDGPHGDNEKPGCDENKCEGQ